MFLKSKEVGKRYSIYPILHPEVWEHYKKCESQIWVSEEIDLSSDKFDELDPQEQLFLKNILAFFNVSDALVISNITDNLVSRTNILESSYFYNLQVAMEQVHQITYANLTEAYIPNKQEQEDMFNAVLTNKAVAKKVAWIEKWGNLDSYPHSLAAFSLVEGILFSSLFAGVFWYRTRNKMPGLCSANELIMKDEHSHYAFGVMNYTKYLKEEFKLPPEELKQMILEAYEVEKTFVEESLPDGLKGLTKDMMIQYVQFVVDIVLKDFGFEPHFGVRSSLEYMASIGLESKNNFFEQRVGDYTRVVLPTEGINFNADF